jgi:predicted lysophospholipase L1 biosynthesis ABC-type transport system permease subunit
VTQAADKSLTVLTVAGVAEDVPISTLGQIEPVVYSVGSGRPEILARDLSPETLERIRAIATTLEPSARMTADPLRDDLAAGAAGETEDIRSIAWMVGAGALALSLIGAFGFFAYTVEERRREIGIRLALGGRAGQVTRAVLRSALRPSVVGVAVGFTASAGAATVMRSAVYGLQPFDALAYVQVAGVLAAATALAALIPARRAARVDPAVTLRAE